MSRSFSPLVSLFSPEKPSEEGAGGPLSAMGCLQNRLGNDCLKEILTGAVRGGARGGPIGAIFGAIAGLSRCGEGEEEEAAPAPTPEPTPPTPDPTPPSPDPAAVDTAEATQILEDLGFGYYEEGQEPPPDVQSMLDEFHAVYHLEEDAELDQGTLDALREAEDAAVSFDELTEIMPHLQDETAEDYLKYLNGAMYEGEIDSDPRQAAFLAQLAHESGELRYMEEIADGSAYEGRTDLGNTQPGDGMRFKGRGPIQLTGRSNYTRASEDLGVDLVADPERAADPDVGFRIASWFWETRGLNALADEGDFVGITRRINGGTNGLESRQQYYEQAQDVLGERQDA